MSSLAVEIPRAWSVNCTDQELIVLLADGRNISVPLVWFPRLAKADARQRADFEILGDGEGIHWPQINEDISVTELVTGKSSVDKGLQTLSPIQRDAYDYLDKIRIDWNGKPIVDRDEANARRDSLTNDNQGS